MLQPETGFKPRDRKARERRVLDAARAVFSESSFEAARIEEVARRAGVSKGTVYNVVGSKEELFLRCLADAMEEARRRIDKLIGDEQAPRAALRALVRALFLDLLPTLVGDRNLRHQAVGALSSSSPIRNRLVGQLRRF
ncbi:MAG: helix-turn-helix domain-containing protein, partial [Myxococcota bacterium]